MRLWSACAVTAVVVQPVWGQQVTVKQHTLANGLKLLVYEDHDVPNAALYLFFRVGSRNERSGVTGMSHFFEHMMFNGAKKYGPKQFDVQMERNGGSNNAYTSQDLTVYTDWFPSRALALMFDMEADRIRDLAFDPKIVASERGVVYSERRSSVDNDNAGLLHEQLQAAAYVAHPYHWPVIGWAPDIEAWTLAGLRAHFRMGYAPNNCVAVVTGAVREAEVLRLARLYLEPIPRQAPPPAVHTKGPERLGERRVTIRKPAQSPLVMRAYHIPEAKHPDLRPLEILARILTQGRSSRLYRRLVDEDQNALSIDASAEWTLDPGLFLLSAQVRPGADAASAEKSIDGELARLRSSGVTAEELGKARRAILVDFYTGIRTIASKANAIGRFEVYHGDHRKLNTYAAEMEKVTAEDVQRVARQYLVSRNRTVAALIPEEAEAAVAK
ncbi:MAG: insulinase family protein [Acidobacteria bacterium]|nr:insulinase family protein [Acidobacteriota bacterium]